MADRLNKKFRKILRLSSRRRSVRPSPGEQATDVASAVTQAPRRSRNGTVYSTLLDIPPETLNTITEMLSLHDKARLLATCKAMKSYIEPQLWCRIKTRIGTSQDTAGLVGLLTDRPDIVPLIKALLMLGIVVFWTKNVDTMPYQSMPYQLTKEDAALFRQPTVERFRLSYVDFSAFETVDTAYFMHTNLRTLDLEDSHHSPEALNRFTSPSRNLTELQFQHSGDPPFVPTHYLPILTPHVATVKVLRLQWRYSRTTSAPDYDGLDLTAFSALRLLRIQPSVLLGPGNGAWIHIRQMIHNRLPPGLKMLLLESLTLPPLHRGLVMGLFPKDKELIRCLIEQRKDVAPRLRYIFMYYLEEMSEPDDLYDLADEHGMEFCALYASDVIDPGWEALDADTYTNKHGQVKSW
ncbi:MAG: hypothetical protein Q9221_003211 [Calogaya cf. arnoldii]